MADPEFILDIAASSSIDRFGPTQYRVTRGCAVVGVETAANDTPYDFLFKVERELLRVKGIKYNDPHPTQSNSYLNRIVIQGSAETATTGAQFSLVYEPFTSTVNTTLLVSVGGSVTTQTAQRIPGTDMEFDIGYDVSGDPLAIPPDVGSASILIPTPQISVYRLQTGTLTEDIALRSANCLGLVNGDQMSVPQGQIQLPPALGGGTSDEGTWMGRQRGAWMVTQFQSDMSRYGGYYSQRIIAQAAGSPDAVWDLFFRLRSRTTGRLAYGKAYTDQKTKDLKKNYKYGYITDQAEAVKNGFLRMGPYKTTPFGPLFGFGTGGSGVLGINNPNPNPFLSVA